MFDVVEVPIALPQIGQVGSSPVARTKSTMTQLRFGSKRVQESGQGVFTALATLMKSKLFGLTTLADTFQSSGDFVQGLVPRDPFPFTFSAPPDTTQWIQQPFGMIQMVQAGVPTRAKMPAAIFVRT